MHKAPVHSSKSNFSIPHKGVSILLLSSTEDSVNLGVASTVQIWALCLLGRWTPAYVLEKGFMAGTVARSASFKLFREINCGQSKVCACA